MPGPEESWVDSMIVARNLNLFCFVQIKGQECFTKRYFFTYRTSLESDLSLGL